MFSHKKAVLKRGFLVEAMLRYPPWDEQKIAMMRHLYRTDTSGSSSPSSRT
jgi:aldehyde dehydrogenase (NAD+)